MFKVKKIVVTIVTSFLLMNCSNIQYKQNADVVNYVAQQLKFDETVNLEKVIPIDLVSFKDKLSEANAYKLSTTIQFFQSLVEWGISLREQSVRFAHELDQVQVTGEPISADLVESLNKGVIDHIAFHQEVLSIVSTYSAAEYSEGRNTHLSEIEQIKAQMLSLAGVLVLFDNFDVAVTQFYANATLRRIINRGDSGLHVDKGILEEVAKSYFSPEIRNRVRKSQAMILLHQNTINEAMKTDKELYYLNTLINTSLSAQKIVKSNKYKDYEHFIKFYLTQSQDQLSQITGDSINNISKTFGNTVGLVQLRHGALYKNKAMVQKLSEKLQPLDILLDQTPFRLTAKFIPGYFGHVAIWTGTEAELKARGLWEHPIIKPYQKQISSGHHVIEALRSGVEINKLDDFMDVDDIVILRKQSYVDNQFNNSVVRAFRQLGKEYDFNFDVETIDKIVCSELAYVVFTDIKWPTEKLVGRSTISPDNVAVMGVNGPLKLVTFIQDGKELAQNKLTKYKDVLGL